MSLGSGEVVAALRELVDYEDRLHAGRKGQRCKCGACPLCHARHTVERWDHGRSQRGMARTDSHVGSLNPKALLTEP